MSSKRLDLVRLEIPQIDALVLVPQSSFLPSGEKARAPMGTLARGPSFRRVPVAASQIVITRR